MESWSVSDGLPDRNIQLIYLSIWIYSSFFPEIIGWFSGKSTLTTTDLTSRKRPEYFTAARGGSIF